ncbi:hypothetical protein BH10ACT11_BH10ACT11_12480 [soil metagenome]
MGFGDRIKRIGQVLGGESHTDGESELHIGDASYDNWEIVRDFADLEAARAWRQTLSEQGITSAITSDYPLDEFGHGDISLRVAPGEWSQAEELLGPE